MKKLEAKKSKMQVAYGMHNGRFSVVFNINTTKDSTLSIQGSDLLVNFLIPLTLFRHKLANAQMIFASIHKLSM